MPATKGHHGSPRDMSECLEAPLSNEGGAHRPSQPNVGVGAPGGGSQCSQAFGASHRDSRAPLRPVENLQSASKGKHRQQPPKRSKQHPKQHQEQQQQQQGRQHDDKVRTQHQLQKEPPQEGSVTRVKRKQHQAAVKAAAAAAAAVAAAGGAQTILATAAGAPRGSRPPVFVPKKPRKRPAAQGALHGGLQGGPRGPSFRINLAMYGYPGAPPHGASHGPGAAAALFTKSKRKKPHCAAGGELDVRPEAAAEKAAAAAAAESAPMAAAKAADPQGLIPPTTDSMRPAAPGQSSSSAGMRSSLASASSALEIGRGGRGGPLVVLTQDDEEIWKQWEGLRLLGEGVYGRVYLVRNRETQETLAFKRMYLHARKKNPLAPAQQQLLHQDSDMEAAAAAPGGGALPAVLQREVAVLRVLRGKKNIINLQKVFIGSFRVYLAFPLIQGGTLADCLRAYAAWSDYIRLPLMTNDSSGSICSTRKRGSIRRSGSFKGSFASSFYKYECLCSSDQKRGPSRGTRETLATAALSDDMHSSPERSAETLLVSISSQPPHQNQQRHPQQQESEDEIRAQDADCCGRVCCCCPCLRCIPISGLPLGLCLRIAFSLLRGVSLFHEKRILHRDIKPDNILLGWTDLPVHPSMAVKTLKQHRNKLTQSQQQRQDENGSQQESVELLEQEADADDLQYQSDADGSSQEGDPSASASDEEPVEEVAAPPPLVSSLFIADFGLARTLPFFTRRECSPGAGRRSPKSQQKLSTEAPPAAGEKEQCEDTPKGAGRSAGLRQGASPTASLRRAAAAAAAAACCGSRDSCCDANSSNTLCLSPEIITLNYRPLEVLLGSSSYTLAVDIWSVGCVLMECLCGCEFIEGSCEFSCILKILQTFGTPSEDDWPELHQLPFMSRLLPSFPSRPLAIESFLAERGRTDALQNPHWMNLLKQLLQVNPDRRISAAEALRMPLFRSLPPSAVL